MKKTIKTFFTADHHFFHSNIIKFNNRPFDNVEEMNEYFIYSWNCVVSEDDTVWHLGDITLSSLNVFQPVLIRLRGNINLVVGNHDKRLIKKINPKYNMKTNSGILKVFQPVEFIKVDGEEIVLSHYAMRTWNKSHYGSWHLYGHSHGMLPSHGKSFDVGVDCTPNYAPMSLQEVKEKMDLLDVHNPV